MRARLVLSFLVLVALAFPAFGDRRGGGSLDRVLPQIQRSVPGTFYDAEGPIFSPDGRPMYRIKWMTPDGRIIWFMVDAQSGQVMGGASGGSRNEGYDRRDDRRDWGERRNNWRDRDNDRDRGEWNRSDRDRGDWNRGNDRDRWNNNRGNRDHDRGGDRGNWGNDRGSDRGNWGGRGRDNDHGNWGGGNRGGNRHDRRPGG